MQFTKAHGFGNDFLLVDVREVTFLPAAWIRRLCDRHLGVGADGLLVCEALDGRTRMRLFNPDGEEAEISANGLRCVAARAVREGRLPARHEVETGAGVRAVEVARLSETRFRVTSELGVPGLHSDAVPIKLDPAREPVVDETLDVDGEPVRITATSIGNPHCTVFSDVVAEDALVRRLGPLLECHEVFPRRTNVEFATLVAPDVLRVRFWERGVGPTRSSGTGSAAAAVAGRLTGRVGRRVRVLCDGGTLDVESDERGHLRQTGEVQFLFDARWLPPLPVKGGPAAAAE